MSRTNKTTKVKFRKDKTWGMPWGGFFPWDRQHWFEEHINDKFKSIPKLRKEQDFKDHWMTTPSWWISMFMNRPMRHRLKSKLSQLKLTEPDTEQLENFDEEEAYSKRPHKYYW